MKIFDISWPITENITEYKDEKFLKITDYKIFEKDMGREKIINIHSHTGTHIDAPAHFLKNGITLDKMDLNKFFGLCNVLDLSYIEEKITSKYLENFNIEENTIILLKTKNSNLNEFEKFDIKHIYLEKTGAQYLADKKIKTLGFDYLGIERNQPNHETHKILLENEIPIIEGLRLKNIEQGIYKLYCFPILIKNADGAPARAILIKN